MFSPWATQSIVLTIAIARDAIVLSCVCCSHDPMSLIVVYMNLVKGNLFW